MISEGRKTYTLVRKEEKKNRKYEHLFYIREKPQLVGYTKNKNERDFFVINDKKYFCRPGNTDLVRPLKNICGQ